MAHHTHTMNREMQECIENCHNCHDICAEAIQHCLEKGGEHAAPGHIRLLIDCAQICHTSEDFMLRGSELHPATCEACARICEECAESCEELDADPMMKECAEHCRRCAESCRAMARTEV